MSPFINARCPGKIILSGEHAVVYGAPALVMAVNQYVDVQVKKMDTPSLAIFFNEKNPIIYPLEKLAALKDKLDLNYNTFLDGKGSLSDVINHPSDLIAYAVMLATKNQLSLKGMQLDIKLGIPIGSGMGSSAALILAVLKSVSDFLGNELSHEELYSFACTTENLQHGQSSGVDPYACLYGGLTRFHADEHKAIEAILPQFYLVNTGLPESTTGECVSHVREKFGESAIWNQFEACTNYIEEAMLNNDLSNLKVGLAKNHSLLSTIDVVPEKVDHFIGSIMHLGGAAKICGGGSIKGDQAGMLLVLSSTLPTKLCNEYGYSLSELQLDTQGLQYV